MEMTRKNKIRNALVKASAFAAAASTVANAAMTQAFAFGKDEVKIKESTGDPESIMGKVIGILLTITRFAGVALCVYGVYEIVMSFMQSQPEAKTKGIIMALSGVVMVAMKSVLQNMGIIG